MTLDNTSNGCLAWAQGRRPAYNVGRRSRARAKLEKPARKVGGEAAHFWCPFFEFWRGGTRSRIVFLEVFARWPLILSDDNIMAAIKFLPKSAPCLCIHLGRIML